MAKLTSKNPVVQEYRRERRRIQQQLRRMVKRGYLPNGNILPEIPKKITAGSVRRLKKLTPQKIYAKSIHLDIDTGEIIEGLKYRHMERVAAGKKGSKKSAVPAPSTAHTPTTSPQPQGAPYNDVDEEVSRILEEARQAAVDLPQKATFPDTPSFIPNDYDIAIDNFLSDISHFNDKAVEVFRQWINDLTRLEGRESVGNMLIEASANGVMIDYKVMYDENLLVENMAEFLDYLDVTDHYREELTESLDEYRGY